jgi:RNA polymerase sigma factor (sigma-70 family)
MPLAAAELAGLIRAHAATLRLWVRGRCNAPDDVVQEAFCRLAVENPPPDNAVAWLYRVCRNLAENERRSAQRRRKREEITARSESSSGGSDPLELAETLAAVEQLEPELRDVLVARIWGQLSLEQIAQLCGISTSTAFRRYEAALRQLRTMLHAAVEDLS